MTIYSLTRTIVIVGGSVAEWLACWTQAQKVRVQIAAATLSGNSLRQTVHTHRASVHQAAKLVAASGVTATPGAPAPPEGPRVLRAPARGKEKIFWFTFRLVIKKIKIYKILNFTCG